MALWLVRAGRHGEQEQAALGRNVAVIGWNDLPDLSKITSKEALKDLYEQTRPSEKKGTVAARVGEIWAFINRIQLDDLVVLPLKLQSAIAVGRVIGPYAYRTDLSPTIRHTRPVQWIKTDLPRTAFDQDLLYSFAFCGTVCRIRRNQAEERVRAILEGKIAPPFRREEAEEPETIDIDIEEVARDQLLDFLDKKFKGHDLARVVEAVLQAQGYVTKRSEPGPDGGVDILAGAGPLGFDSPRMCVQVKSSSSPVDVNALRGLQGSMQSFHADQGLLVSWGGFNRATLEEARRSFFKVRLWDFGSLVDAMLNSYERLPDDLQAELPLKRIWALVKEEE
jgi:restriction system protein